MRVYAVALGSAVSDPGNLTPTGYVTQKRADADDGTQSVDGTVTFNSDLWDAIFAQMRWVGGRLMFEGPGGLQEVAKERHAQVQLVRTLTPGDQATLQFETVGSLWSFPSITPSKDAYGGKGQPPGATGFSPRLWGNKIVEWYQSFGLSPLKMKERKLYRGLTFEKRNKGNTQVTATIGCVDDSIRYADVPICYELAPMSGKLRGSIVRDVAVLAGVPKDKIICPAGSPVNKPILLTNASLIPFVTDLGVPENWFCFFDENGNFVVEEIELKLKEDADWVFDAELGDFYLDTFEEVLPSRPPQKYFSTGTGPGGNDDSEVTTETTSEQEGLYAPLCIKQIGILCPDGQYRTQLAPQRMITGRVTTRVTTKGGIEIRRIVITESIYNPMKADPNFDTDPAVKTQLSGTITNVATSLTVVSSSGFPATPFIAHIDSEDLHVTLVSGSTWTVTRGYHGTTAVAHTGGVDVTVTPDYDLAYGDKSFHRDLIEGLIETSRVVTENTVDQYGTLLGQSEATQGWLAPKSHLFFTDSKRSGVKNYPGNWFFPAWSSKSPSYSARQFQQEQYIVTQKIERTFTYDADGNIDNTIEELTNWNAPQSRSSYPAEADIGIQPPTPPQPPIVLAIAGPTTTKGAEADFTVAIPKTAQDKYPGVNLSTANYATAIYLDAVRIDGARWGTAFALDSTLQPRTGIWSAVGRAFNLPGQIQPDGSWLFAKGVFSFTIEFDLQNFDTSTTIEHISATYVFDPGKRVA